MCMLRRMVFTAVSGWITVVRAAQSEGYITLPITLCHTTTVVRAAQSEGYITVNITQR